MLTSVYAKGHMLAAPTDQSEPEPPTYLIRMTYCAII